MPDGYGMDWAQRQRDRQEPPDPFEQDMPDDESEENYHGQS